MKNLNALEHNISMMNSCIKFFQANNINIIDSDNLNWEITKVRYDEVKDEVYFDTAEFTRKGASLHESRVG